MHGGRVPSVGGKLVATALGRETIPGEGTHQGFVLLAEIAGDEVANELTCLWRQQDAVAPIPAGEEQIVPGRLAQNRSLVRSRRSQSSPRLFDGKVGQSRYELSGIRYAVHQSSRRHVGIEASRLHGGTDHNAAVDLGDNIGVLSEENS